jgi:hypothetical protein
VALRVIEASANGVRELPDLERLAIGDSTGGPVLPDHDGWIAVRGSFVQSEIAAQSKSP